MEHLIQKWHIFEDDKQTKHSIEEMFQNKKYKVIMSTTAMTKIEEQK